MIASESAHDYQKRVSRKRQTGTDGEDIKEQERISVAKQKETNRYHVIEETCLRGVIEDDLPASTDSLEDKAENAFCRATSGRASIKMKMTGDGGGLSVEQMDCQLRERELAPCGRRRILLFVMCQDFRAGGFGDLIRAKERASWGIGRHEFFQIAAVPCFDLLI